MVGLAYGKLAPPYEAESEYANNAGCSCSAGRWTQGRSNNQVSFVARIENSNL
jgi:hypothetical protein